MTDGQAIAAALSILCAGSCIGYFGLRAILPDVSSRHLFWWASTLPPLILLGAIGAADYLNSRPDDLNNPFTHFGKDLDSTVVLISLFALAAFWVPSAMTVMLLRLSTIKK
jgi:hypothetical protein